MRTTNKLLALLCVFALAAVGAAAQSPGKGAGDDKLVLENDHVTVWFQGKKPMLKVFPTANATEDGENVSGAYSYKFTEVVEYRDLDGDGVPSDNEVLASLNLNAANAWVVNQSESDDGATLLNLTLMAPVKLGPKTGAVPLPQDVNVSLPDRVAEVSLNFSIRGETTTLDAGGVNVTVPATAIKYDFGVARWPFVDPSGSRLALVMHVDGALEMGNATGEGVEGATVAANETRVGALSWTSAAMGTTSAGAVEVPVKTAARTEGAQTRLVHTYDAAGLATLLHDPTIGVAGDEESLGESGGADGTKGGGNNQVPGPAAVLALAGLGVTALLMRGRRGAA